MNKIILDKENSIDLNITEDSICYIDKSYNINELNITISDDKQFIINHYNEIDKSDLTINVKQNNNSVFEYNHSFKVNNLYNLNINVILEGKKSKNTINIHGISDNGTSNIKVDGKVIDNTVDNELFENIKLLNINDGKSYIYPNMYINTKNVVANHAASITTMNKDYLFYLNSKGINNEDATKLIIDGFLDIGGF